MWQQYLPRIQEHCRAMRSRDYASMSLTQLAGSLDGLFTDTAAAFRMTTVLIFAYLRPMAAVVSFCETELGEDGASIAARLMQGSANETSASGYGLSDLTERAAALPAVSDALKAGRFDSLNSTAGGPEFLQRLRAFLDEYGWRAESWALPHVPTWAENPQVPLALIARYLANPERTPAAALRRSAESRRAAVAEAESRLSGAALDEFRRLLAVAEQHVPISEARALWQLLIIGSIRVPVVALGEKLVQEGVIEAPNDIFYLTVPEVIHVAAAPRPLQPQIAQREQELQRCEELTPPPFLGAPPAMDRAPPDLRSVMRHLRGYGVLPSEDARVINGMGASKGKARGTARVLRGLDQAARLQEGDILVCRTTAPPWTPLFSLAAAVVTDAGGILSHSAICAREYGIPAVVGTQMATARIPDGAIVVVDGDKGTVTLEA
jgi:pyruvate,water dikinase